MKRKLLVLLVCVVCIAAVVFIQQNRIIGTISGAEWEKISIDGVVYYQDDPLDFSAADKDKYLGKVRGGDVTFRVYNVKGDTENRYIYRLWGYDGAFYSTAQSLYPQGWFHGEEAMVDYLTNNYDVDGVSIAEGEYLEGGKDDIGEYKKFNVTTVEGEQYTIRVNVEYRRTLAQIGPEYKVLNIEVLDVLESEAVHESYF